MAEAQQVDVQGTEEKQDQHREAAKAESARYGGCVGLDSIDVNLVSGDGHEFLVKRENTPISEPPTNMSSGPGRVKENQPNEIILHHIPSRVLRRVCVYCGFKDHHEIKRQEKLDFPVATGDAFELALAENVLRI